MDSAAATLAPCDDQLLLDCSAEVSRSPAGVTVCIDTIDRTALADEEWAALAKDAAEANVFAEHWFMRPSVARLGAGRDIRMAEVREGARLIGLLPLVQAARYGRLPVTNTQNWLHHHSFLGTPLIRAGYERSFWTALLDALDRDCWAHGLLHINGLVEHGPAHRGLTAAAGDLRRPCDVVHRCSRALLESRLAPAAYYEQTVRKKKRKELKRLQARLADLGKVEIRRFQGGSGLTAWCDAFLALERAGWKGSGGSALGCHPQTEAFFREAVAGAARAGKLEFLRLDLDGRPLAMLVNFVTLPGSFSFKIAFDEAYARFSPGVLLQLENLDILDRPGFGWMDSCASEDHPMINSLWGERRSIVRVSVPLSGSRRRALFALCRLAEKGWAAAKNMVRPGPAPALQEDEHG